MEQVYQFDFVHDTQAVFRQLLMASAHPMSVRSVAEQLPGFSWSHPELWVVGCTLMDNETTFYVEMDADLEKGLADLTLARHAAPNAADYIFLSAQLNYDTIRSLFAGAKKGTLEDPQKSAAFLISCPELSGNVAAEARGPGIQGTRRLSLSPYVAGICGLRTEFDGDYPCGIDLFFLSGDGQVMALPRLCRVVVKDGVDNGAGTAAGVTADAADNAAASIRSCPGGGTERDAELRSENEEGRVSGTWRTQR